MMLYVVMFCSLFCGFVCFLYCIQNGFDGKHGILPFLSPAECLGFLLFSVKRWIAGCFYRLGEAWAWYVHMFRSWLFMVSTWFSICANCWQILAIISSKVGSVLTLIACQASPYGTIAKLFVGHSGAFCVVMVLVLVGYGKKAPIGIS